jgi:hypothetical protein
VTRCDGVLAEGAGEIVDQAGYVGARRDGNAGSTPRD